MRRSFLLLLMLAGCGQAEQNPQRQGDAAAGSGVASRSGGAITDLTGLYEGGGAGQTNQLCMVVNSPSDTRFGLVVWGSAQHSCSGSGSADRNGDRLQLRMTGDETCVIDARITGNAIMLPDNLPGGCSYYCGAQARMTGTRFTQSGTGRDEAIKAKDLVGDPLC